MAHQQFTTCIEACNDCAVACGHCASACLKESDPKPTARCIALDIDCAQICLVASAFMARGSEFAGPFARNVRKSAKRAPPNAACTT